MDAVEDTGAADSLETRPLRTSDFDFALPPALIAQTPAERRDDARLLVVHRAGGTLEHRRVSDLPAYLAADDVLVLNDTRVLPARLLGRKEGTGGEVEILLLREHAPDVWHALVRPGRRLPHGTKVIVGDGSLRAEIGATVGEGQRVVRLSVQTGEVREALDTLGQLPLPPYIQGFRGDVNRYQTVYARAEGSVAAPTAGLHFTPELLERIQAGGTQLAYLTLHVGLGTFRPVQADLIAEHRLHAEWATLPAPTAELVTAARARGGRCIAVGTTSTRTLEAAAQRTGAVVPFSGETDLFIYPGYRFRVVDVLLTNFHLPRSSLLMLVSAFAGTELVRHAYAEAIRLGYRFYSFGDAMLLL